MNIKIVSGNRNDDGSINLYFSRGIKNRKTIYQLILYVGWLKGVSLIFHKRKGCIGIKFDSWKIIERFYLDQPEKIERIKVMLDGEKN